MSISDPKKFLSYDGLVEVFKLIKTADSGLEAKITALENAIGDWADLDPNTVVQAIVSLQTLVNGTGNNSVSKKITDAIAAALNNLNAGGIGKYVESVKVEDGKLTATAKDLNTSAVTLDTTVTGLTGTTLSDALNEVKEALDDLKGDGEGSVGTQIATAIQNAIEGLDATVSSQMTGDDIETGKHVGVKVVETDGKLTEVVIKEQDIASKAVVDEVLKSLGLGTDGKMPSTPADGSIADRLKDLEDNTGAGKDYDNDKPLSERVDGIEDLLGIGEGSTAGSTSIPDQIKELKDNSFASVAYAHGDANIVFKNATGGTVGTVSVADFIHDGLLEKVEIVDVEGDDTDEEEKAIRFTFKVHGATDTNRTVDVKIGDLFDTGLYYTKTEVDSIKTELETAIENANKSATTKVVADAEDTNTTAHLEVTPNITTTGDTYTLKLKDVASDAALTAEVTRATTAEQAVYDAIDAIPTTGDNSIQAAWEAAKEATGASL